MARPSPVPFSGSLVVEERLEDAAQDLGRNSRTGVGHLGVDHLAVRTHRVARAEQDLAARRHRIAGIHGQVEEQPVDLGRIGQHLALRGVQFGGHANPLANGLLQQSHQFHQRGVQVLLHGPRLGVVGGLQQAGGDLHPPLGRAMDDLGRLVEVLVAFGLGLQLVGVGVDGHQDVVEVVGHAAGEQVEDFGALHHLRSRLMLFGLGDVASHGLDPRSLSIHFHQPGEGLQVYRRAALGQDAKLVAHAPR